MKLENIAELEKLVSLSFDPAVLLTLSPRPILIAVRGEGQTASGHRATTSERLTSETFG